MNGWMDGWIKWRYQHWGCFCHRCHGDGWWRAGHYDPGDSAAVWLHLPPGQISTPAGEILSSAKGQKDKPILRQTKRNVVLLSLSQSVFFCSSSFLLQTLMALSAPLVINSGSACRKLAAATAVLCACLCWVTTWRRSRSQKAMWPWGLPDARMGGPSNGRHRESQSALRAKTERETESERRHLFWKRACWLVPSPAWSSLVFRPIGCCEWWCGLTPCQCQPHLPQDSAKCYVGFFYFILKKNRQRQTDRQNAVQTPKSHLRT